MQRPANKHHRTDLISSTSEVLVGIGESQQMFSVHEHIITKRSKYFRAGRKKSWDWDNEAKRMLLGENPHVFSAYLHTLYFDADNLRERVAEKTDQAIAEDLSPSEYEEKNSGDYDRDARYDLDNYHDTRDDLDNYHDTRYDHPSKKQAKAEAETATFLVDLYILTDKLRDPTTANIVMDELVEFLGSKVHLIPAITTKVYASTRNGSMLRLLVRDLYIHDAKMVWPSKD